MQISSNEHPRARTSANERMRYPKMHRDTRKRINAEIQMPKMHTHTHTLWLKIIYEEIACAIKRIRCHETASVFSQALANGLTSFMIGFISTTREMRPSHTDNTKRSDNDSFKAHDAKKRTAFVILPSLFLRSTFLFQFSSLPQGFLYLARNRRCDSFFFIVRARNLPRRFRSDLKLYSLLWMFIRSNRQLE